MKKLSILAIFVIFLLGCFSPTQTTSSYKTSSYNFNEPKYSKAFYNVELESVEKPKDATERYGESKILTSIEDSVTKYTYQDKLIDMIWIVTEKQFNFNLLNKSDHSIKIIWDEVVYVDESGSSNRVIHSGVKYIDRNNSQPPTIVVRNSKVDDMIVPSNKISYSSGSSGGWRIQSMFTNYSMSVVETDSIANNIVGKEVQIFFPIQIEEIVNEYIFIFKVKNYTTKKVGILDLF